MRHNIKTKSRGISLLRVIAIVLIIIFHISDRTLPGGFIGVDLFFVMSGYLTMDSLYEKYGSKTRVRMWEFISKKYRKLSPALYTMIVLVLIYLVIFNKPILENSNLDALSGFTFTSNIWYIVKKVDYFSSFGAKPFNHLWYLSVQFQFYLIFILILELFGLKLKKRFDGFTKIILGLFFASFIYNIFIFDIDNINRIYYGTDTRAYEFLLGVLAARIMPIRFVEQRFEFFRKYKKGISLVSIALFIILSKTISQYSFWLYRGGFLLIDLLCLIIIYSTSASLTNTTSKVIEKSPINFIGDISYDLYIWHYPIIVLSQTSAEIDKINPVYTIIRIIAILIIALICKEFVSKSINRSSFSGFIKKIVYKYRNRGTAGKRITLVLTTAIIVLSVMGLIGKAMPFTSTFFINEKKSVDIGESYVVKDKKIKPIKKEKSNKSKKKYDPLALKPMVIGENNAKTGYMEIDNPKKDPTKLTLKENINEMKYNQLVVVGDSLAVNVGPAIKAAFPETIADGKISRQLYNSSDVVNQYVNYDSEDTALIFLLGTNGVFMESHIDGLIASFKLSDIYFVNVKVPGNYEDQVNKTLSSYASKHKERVSVVDWNSIAKKHPEYLEPDKTHLNKDGVNAIVKLIFENLSK